MSRRLGIIDWGIGGLSVYKLIKERRPEVSVVYFSDTGATPYGKMSRMELVARLNAVIGFLKSQGVTHLVIGCNAASTVIPYLNLQGLKIEGVIDAAVEMTARLKPKRLGLIGGRRTVVSGVYRKAFAKRGIEVQQRIAQPLSGLIERGDVSSAKLRSECARILPPIRKCSHLLLACTHYPAIADMIRFFVSPQTVLVDPSIALASRAIKWRLPTGGKDAFFTTGDAGQMQASARAAFQCTIGRVKIVSLDQVM